MLTNLLKGLRCKGQGKPLIDLRFAASFGRIMKFLFPTQHKKYRKSLLMVTAVLAAAPKKMFLKGNGQQTLKNFTSSISMFLLAFTRGRIGLCFTSAFQI